VTANEGFVVQAHVKIFKLFLLQVTAKLSPKIYQIWRSIWSYDLFAKSIVKSVHCIKWAQLVEELVSAIIWWYVLVILNNKADQLKRVYYSYERFLICLSAGSLLSSERDTIYVQVQ